MGAIAQLILAEIPDIVQAIKDAHAVANPEADPITSEEVINGLQELFLNSFARGEALRIAVEAEIAADQ